MNDHRKRLAHLLRRNRRRHLIPGVVQMWKARGVAVSVLSDERQQDLLARLPVSEGADYQPTRDVPRVLRDFVNSASTVTVMDWDANEQPALLVPASALLRSESDLRAIYPDGFILVHESCALIVDFYERLGDLQVAHRLFGDKENPS